MLSQKNGQSGKSEGISLKMVIKNTSFPMQPIFQWVDTSPHIFPPKENKTAGPKLLQFKFKTMNRRNDINHNFGTDKTFPFLICHPFLERTTLSYLSNLFILVIYNHQPCRVAHGVDILISYLVNLVKLCCKKTYFYRRYL